MSTQNDYDNAVARSHAIKQTDHTAAGSDAAHQLADVNHYKRAADAAHTYGIKNGALQWLFNHNVAYQPLGQDV